MNTHERIHLILLAAVLLLSSLIGRADAQESVPVTVTQVRSENMSPSIPAAGTVFSRNQVQITAGIAARIEWVAEPGDFVTKGEAVARFDCEMLELRREEQKAVADRERINMESLERETRRLEQLQIKLIAAGTQVDRMRADRDLAASELRIARVRTRQIESELRRCIVRAPFSGVITQRLQRAGEDVERSTMLAMMTDTQNLEVRASVPIRHLPRVTAGGAADIQSGELHMEGRIRKIVPAADPLSQTFQMRVDLPADASSYLAAGQLVSVRFALLGTTAMTVPRDSIVLHEDGTFVMRINDDQHAERIAVEIADASGDRIAIRGELSPGDQVAVRGAEALDDGQAVTVQTES